MLISRIALWVAIISLLTAAPVLADDSRNDDDRVVVVTHLDIIPTFTAQAQPVIEQFVIDSRKDPGVELFIVISWTPTTNHFQLIEVYKNQRAFDAHIGATHTIQFRTDLQAFIGAPYDERLYSVLRH
jgi:quinol monooxygenase YgiN